MGQKGKEELVVLTLAGAPPPHRGLLHFVAGDGAAVGFGAVAPVCALLHPLHHQIQQGGHGQVHVDTCHCVRLKVGDAWAEQRGKH